MPPPPPLPNLPPPPPTKQVLYFDRYTRLLAPGLDVMNDDRMAMNRPPPTTAPMVSLEGAQGEGVDVQTDGDVVQVQVLSESEPRQKSREGSAGAADAE